MKNIVWLDKKDNLRGNWPKHKTKVKFCTYALFIRDIKKIENFMNVCIFVSGAFFTLLPLFTSPFLN